MFWGTCKATWWATSFWINVFYSSYHTLTTCTTSTFLGQQQTSNTLWQAVDYKQMCKSSDFHRRSLIGVPSVLLWCSANFMMKTLFGGGGGSKCLWRLKVGQEKQRATSENAPVTSSTVATLDHFIHVMCALILKTCFNSLLKVHITLKVSRAGSQANKSFSTGPSLTLLKRDLMKSYSRLAVN